MSQGLQKLREHGLKIEAPKCQFFQRHVNYLGHVLSSQGVATDTAKTKALAYPENTEGPESALTVVILHLPKFKTGRAD